MLTYQDYETALAAGELTRFVEQVISDHKQSEMYKTAIDADAYDHQRNTTILTFVSEVKRRRNQAFTQDIKIPCNLFRRLNKQRCTYLLGNGVSFTNVELRPDPETGELVLVDLTKEQLGSHFDADVYIWAYKALIHGESYGYWTPDRIYNFPVTQFAPLRDEESDAVRAGVRFWRIDPAKPLFAELYTEAGIYYFRSGTATGNRLELTDPNPTPYLLTTASTEARGEWITGEQNYSTLPVIPMYGSDLHQSTLVGMKARIDAIDMVSSGFARDVRDCAKIYWLVENCGGMEQKDLDKFLDDILEYHIAQVDSTSFSGDTRAALTPYVQDVPVNSSTAFLKQATEALYQDFGALDVHAIGANSTNDHLDAAYQPLDEETDEFEREVSTAIKAGLTLMGIDDDPKYNRNRVVNESEYNTMILNAANIIGTNMVLKKLTFLDPDEVEEVEQQVYADGLDRLKAPENEPQTPADESAAAE